MSNTQNHVTFYDHTTKKFTYTAHAKFREVFEQNPHPTTEQIRQLSKETGAPFLQCQVCNIHCIDLSKRIMSLIFCRQNCPNVEL